MADQPTPLDLLTNAGSAAGQQAQFNLLLQAVTRIAETLLKQPTNSPFQPYPWTAAGPLVIATSFPSVTSGMFSIRQGTPAAINVTLPSTGGPWTVADGAGVAGADNITVLAPGGFTINNAASNVISTNWQSRTYVLDGTNFLVFTSV